MVEAFFQEMFKMAKLMQRGLTKSFIKKIPKRMESAYGSATKVKGGRGMFKWIKNEMTTRAKAYVESMFDLPMKELLKGIEVLLGVLSKMICELSIVRPDQCSSLATWNSLTARFIHVIENTENTESSLHCALGQPSSCANTCSKMPRLSPLEAVGSIYGANCSHVYAEYGTAVPRFGGHGRCNLGGELLQG